MKNFLLLAAAAAGSMIAAVSASAAPYLFTYQTGPTAVTQQSGSFTLDSNPVPTSYSDGKGFFQIANVAGVYSNGLTTANIDFFLSTAPGHAGGIELDEPGGNAFFFPTGAQVFTGTLANPTFVLGSYTLSNRANLTISAIAAVPEAATWAMMLVGFGALGAVTRRQRHKVSVRYA